MSHALIIGDPWDRIRPQSDTSLGLADELLKRNWKVSWTFEAAISWVRDRVMVEAEPFLATHLAALPDLGPLEHCALEDFSLVLIRKDPPFDETYLRLCWILGPYENVLQFCNRPSSLATHHEKMIPLELLKSGLLKLKQIIPPWMPGELHRFRNSLLKMTPAPEQWVTKPWLGYQGNQVELVPHRLLAEWRPNESYFIAQEFDESVRTEGDRRVFFINGKYVGDFVRLPAPQSIVSNLAQGGSAKLAPLKPQEEELIHALEQWLQKERICLAGADFIGGRLNEVNITSPTGFVVYQNLTGTNLSAKAVEAMV